MPATLAGPSGAGMGAAALAEDSGSLPAAHGFQQPAPLVLPDVSPAQPHPVSQHAMEQVLLPAHFCPDTTLRIMRRLLLPVFVVITAFSNTASLRSAFTATVVAASLQHTYRVIRWSQSSWARTQEW